MADPARFWNRMAERYAKHPIADEAAYQKKLEVTRGYFTPASRVLELGCGTASTALLHAPHVAHIDAVDCSEKMLAIARRKAEAEGIQNIAFHESTVEAFEAPDESYDVVLALSLLHLLPDKERAAEKIHRLLKPGGVFVSSTACLGDFFPAFRYLGPVARGLGLAPMVKVFTSKQLEACLAERGFAIEHRWSPGKAKGYFLVARKPG